MYKSCLRELHYYVQSELTKAGSLTVENMLLHHLIAYRNTNHGQSTSNDLKFLYVVKEGIWVNWPDEIFNVISDISSSSSRLMAYGIFISRVFEHVGIDTSNEDLIVVNLREYL
ncbi:hypothetical protein Lal_00038075 [Lupinus albus]|nr:hypothetical protein Lal_00038075 [Lupinus albus]